MIDFEAPASFNSTPVLPILKDYLVVRLTGRLAKSGKVDGATDSNAADIWHRKIFLLGFAVILNLCFKHQRKQTKEIEQCLTLNPYQMHSSHDLDVAAERSCLQTSLSQPNLRDNLSHLKLIRRLSGQKKSTIENGKLIVLSCIHRSAVLDCLCRSSTKLITHGFVTAPPTGDCRGRQVSSTLISIISIASGP